MEKGTTKRPYRVKFTADPVVKKYLNDNNYDWGDQSRVINDAVKDKMRKEGRL